MSAGNPWTCTGITARVRSVTRSSIRRGSSVYEMVDVVEDRVDGACVKNPPSA